MKANWLLAQTSFSIFQTLFSWIKPLIAKNLFSTVYYAFLALITFKLRLNSVYISNTSQHFEC